MNHIDDVMIRIEPDASGEQLELPLDNMAATGWSGAVDTIDLGPILDDLSVTSGVTLSGSSDVYTISSSSVLSPLSPSLTLGSQNLSWGDTMTLDPHPGGRIDLRGEGADIDINGVSLMDTLRGIQDRLNILRPNQSLEKEWDELRELGERYRALEAELTDKQRAWDALRS